MRFFVLFLFIAIPVSEIAVFIQVGDLIGLWPTLAVVILTAIIGTALLRAQGLATLMRAQTSLDQGVVPAVELFDGVCLLLAGALLLTPGFLTDSVGFLLFFPPFRALIRGKIFNAMKARSQFHVHTHGPARPQNEDPDGVIIDAQYEEVPPNQDSPWSDKKE